MKRHLLALAAITLAALSACGPVVMGQRLAKKNVCPSADTDRCVQSTGNMTPIYIARWGRYIPVTGTSPPDYWAYLGRMWSASGTPVANFCGNVIANPFKAYEAARNRTGESPAFAVLGPPVIDSNFYFKRKATDRKALEGAFDIAKVLNLAGVPTGVPGRAQAEANLKVMASRTANSSINMEGNYQFVYIDPATVAALFAEDVPAELKPCADYLRANDAAMVTGLTGVLVRALSVENTTQSKIDADLQAGLGGVLTADQIAKVGLEWKREVDEVFRSETQPVFQLLSLSHQKLPGGA